MATFLFFMLNVSILSFAYDKKPTLSNISFQLQQGEHLAVLGESGCGKSTLLHLIYGLLQLEEGSILWNDKKLLGPKENLIPGEKNMKLVAQEFNVMPYISVTENIATHLSRQNKEQDEKRVKELLEVVDLVAYKDILVKNLSGGQKQRVAIAKALAEEPRLLLLDEPFSDIDTFQKNKLRRNLYHHLKSKDITCITATHDADEALAFSDVICILKEGTIDAFGKTKTVYNNISSVYQAGFFGEVTVLPSTLFSSEKPSEKLILLPYQLVLSEVKTTLKVQITKQYFKGSHYLIEGKFENEVVYFNASERISQETVYLKLKR
ncbi:ABC transporter ATP-binding protein [Jejudonia soesokkakensis]|uniref:ABC transporter ATP-binding protein n=1 Tax=Jejudonia soesokkakensis TaxID=1323432 RepID=A0ABW2MMU0_9FLAO